MSLNQLRCYCYYNYHVSVQIENNFGDVMLLYHVSVQIEKLYHVSVQIENTSININFTALCNATLALNKWEGLTLMLYYLSMGYLHARLIIATSA